MVVERVFHAIWGVSKFEMIERKPCGVEGIRKTLKRVPVRVHFVTRCFVQTGRVVKRMIVSMVVALQ